MTLRVSRLYGMDIYNDEGKFLGKVQEVVVDLEKGEVVRILTEPLASMSREDAKRILKEKSVLYKYVKSVEDVVMVAKQVGPSPPLE
ncbi:MAG: PRC-barrel domain-containing protein [Candidatus Burarchaeum sp.]|nr:PRC-barrel domain-containing protein [Candidatus Burarchaeum sp.]MDO8339758.1 PRC-barrel domain-containing protein [Candidatus Burarchaeum sp.]